AGVVQHVAGNAVAARLARADARQEQQVAGAPGVRIQPYRFRSAGADDVGSGFPVTHGKWVSQYWPPAYLMHTVLGSVKKRKASSPPSRPTPLCLTPPNGVRRSRSSQQFTQTVPHSNRSATRWARSRSRVHSDADKPNGAALA